MGWTSYYTNRTNKEECLHIVSGYKGTVKKTVMQGNKFYALICTPSNEDWVLLLLTSRSKGEFYYKDIQCNPHEHGVPASILKAFTPSNDNDKRWLEENLALLEEKKKEPKFNIGDVVKCIAKYDIDWGYFKVKTDEEFFVRVEHSGKKGKLYRVVTKDGERFRETNYRLMNKSFENATKDKTLETHLMTTPEKIDILQDIVINECYCLWDLFIENVNNAGQYEFREKFQKCNSREELRKLVNQYI